MVEQMKTKDDVFAAIDKHNVRFVRLWFTDILGFTKSFAINTNELDGAFSEGMGFDGSSITGFQKIEESDINAGREAGFDEYLAKSDQNRLPENLARAVRTTANSLRRAS